MKSHNCDWSCSTVWGGGPELADSFILVRDIAQADWLGGMMLLAVGNALIASA